MLDTQLAFAFERLVGCLSMPSHMQPKANDNLAYETRQITIIKSLWIELDSLWPIRAGFCSKQSYLRVAMRGNVCVCESLLVC